MVRRPFYQESLMKLYACKVRLGGAVTDEVRKPAVTSAEINILQTIHGEDAVLEVKETANAATNDIPGHPRFGQKRTDDDERDRLETMYGERLVAIVFGPRTKRMTDLSVDVEPLPQRTRVARKPDAVFDAAALTGATEPALMD